MKTMRDIMCLFLLSSNAQVFKIGTDKVEEGEQMEYDNSAYRMYHRLNVEWPCLSFDIISDNLGAIRRRVSFFSLSHPSLLILSTSSLGRRLRPEQETRSSSPRFPVFVRPGTMTTPPNSPTTTVTR